MKHLLKFFLFLVIPFFVIGQDFDPTIQEHVSKLKYLDEEHAPLWILFSGTPGMGKTTVAKLLEDEFHAVRISSDDGRNLLRKHGIAPEQKNPETNQPLIIDYFAALANYLQGHSRNQFFILDKSEDRTLAHTLEYTQARNIPTFLIRLHLSPEQAQERIRLSKIAPEHYLPFFSKWWNDYQHLDVSRVDYHLDTSGRLEDLDLYSLFDAIHGKTRVPTHPQDHT